MTEEVSDINYDELCALADDVIRNKLENDVRVLSSTSKKAKCYWACVLLREETKPAVPYRLLAHYMEVSHVLVHRYYKEYNTFTHQPGSPGRHAILCEEHLYEVSEFIETAFLNRNPVTAKAVQSFIQEHYGIFVLNNTIHHILSKLDRFKTVVAHPMEESRVQVTTEQIIQYLCFLAQQLNGVPAHFIFNMDEMGHQEFADANDKIVFVPIEYTGNSISYPVSRTGRRITLVAAIGLDGSYLRPMIIVPRKTIDDDLLLLGITTDKCLIVSQPKGFIDTAIFDKWFEEIFLPEIEHRRSTFQYNGPTFLILDGCVCHHSPHVEQLCETYFINIIYLPAHSSNQTQALDLSIFGLTKSTLNRINRLDSVNIQSSHIAAVLSAFQSSATIPNIVKAFSNAGITIVKNDDPVLPIICKIDPVKMRCLLSPLLGVSTDESGMNAEEEDMDEDWQPENDSPNEEEDSQNTPLYLELFKRHFAFTHYIRTKSSFFSSTHFFNENE
jgi:hypothetical protein